MRGLSFLKMKPTLAISAALTILVVSGVLVPSTVYADANSPQDTCSGQMPGDVNGDGIINSQDLTALQEILGVCSAPAPTPAANADPNGDCIIDGQDAYYLSQYLYQSGPAPVTCTCLAPSLNKTWLHSGNANGDGGIDISDCVFIIQYIFAGGAGPGDDFRGDTNCDCAIDIGDAVAVLMCVFSGGLCGCNCDEWLSHCGAN